MSYSEDFSAISKKMTFSKDNDVQLLVKQPGIYYESSFRYNFMTRMLVYSSGVYNETSGAGVAPFSQLDPEMLAAMRDKLIELGGKPPALPASDSAPFSPIRKGPQS